MLREREARAIDISMSIVAWTATVTAATIGAFLKADENRYKDWPYIVSAIIVIKAAAWWSLPCTTIIAAILQKLRSDIGSARRWNTVQVVLDQYRDQVFAGFKNDPEYHHRVTIFKYVKWRLTFLRWPWSGWIVPVARSGVTRKSKISCFRASLDDPTTSEGIGGQSFSGNRTLSIDGLPDLTAANVNNDDIRRYAERTFLPVTRVTQRTLTARSLVAFPLEVKGKLWGCIVLDSHHPGKIAIKGNVYSMLAKVLDELFR